LKVKADPEVSALTSTTTATTSTSSSLSDKDIVIKIKIENAIEGLSPNCFNDLSKRVLPGSRGKENVITLCDYISCLKSEINPSDHYRKDTIILLCKLSIFFKNDKLFKEITREDFLLFLDSYRKLETVDPLHKWIGTYNSYRIHLMRFFNWLYYPLSYLWNTSSYQHQFFENQNSIAWSCVCYALLWIPFQEMAIMGAKALITQDFPLMFYTYKFISN
jgi:hypothetical protein